MGNPFTSLVSAADHGFVRAALAKNPASPLELLTALADMSDEVHILESAAKHPNTASAMLGCLATHTAEEIRAEVARRASAPSETLIRLAADPSRWVRKCLAMNHGAPPTALARLALGDEVVRRQLALNPATPEDWLRMFVTDEDEEVRSGVALNPQADAAMIGLLGFDAWPPTRARHRKAANGSPPIPWRECGTPSRRTPPRPKPDSPRCPPTLRPWCAWSSSGTATNARHTSLKPS